ncbi:hypothetical protein EV361DRAFT_943585 [Lentinula raphanica]|nr:hypothetical protein EV361DRAFT_943585 [Lentinula raphanica]
MLLVARSLIRLGVVLAPELQTQFDSWIFEAWGCLGRSRTWKILSWSTQCSSFELNSQMALTFRLHKIPVVATPRSYESE